MSKTLSFIGAGRMGGALIEGACKKAGPKAVTIYDCKASVMESLAEKTGCAAASDMEEAVKASDYIILCVKPQVMAETIKELLPLLRAELEAGRQKTLVSIAAGIPLAAYKELLGGLDIALIRVMPSISASVGRGILLFAADETVEEALLTELMELLSDCGLTERLPESALDASTALCGCSPAFIAIFIEAMADAGVDIGFSRAQALRYAAQTVMGTAAMILESDIHPALLKDAVCSPGGSTIAGVAELEKAGLRSAVWQAVARSYEKTMELGK